MLVSKKCQDSAIWDEIVHDLDGHPLQLWGWGELKSQFGWSATRVIFTDADERVVGATQILTRRLPWPFVRYNYVPRGPVWREGKEQAVLDALSRYAKDHLPGVAIAIEPDDEDVAIAGEWRQSNNTVLIPNTMILDLNLSEPSLQKAMSKKTRQYIKKSGREEVAIRRVRTDEEIDGCLDIYAETSRRAGFAIHSRNYYHAVNRELGDSSAIFAVYERKNPIAFLWLAVSAKTAFELYGGMNDRGQLLRANYHLKWQAISTCRKWGIDRYDINGLLNDNISKFKKGFASHQNTLVGTYDLPLSAWYNLWAKGLPVVKKTIQTSRKLAFWR